MEYRYKNIMLDHMIEVNRKTNKDGMTIIFVNRCSKYLRRNFKYTLDKKENL